MGHHAFENFDCKVAEFGRLKMGKNKILVCRSNESCLIGKI